MSDALTEVVVVLVEPWEPGNVGATVRAMGNLGVRELRMVVSHREHRARLKEGDARRLATHSVPLLDAASFFDDLAPALADCTAAYAFSARVGRERAPRRSFYESMTYMAEELATSKVALVFGTEERGLSSEDLAQVPELVCIPLPGEQTVLNLSQAVLLALWELAEATQRVGENAPLRRPPPLRSALSERTRVREIWCEALTSLGYDPSAPEHLHARILRRILDLLERGGNERDDAAMLLGLAHRILRSRTRTDQREIKRKSHRIQSNPG